MRVKLRNDWALLVLLISAIIRSSFGMLRAEILPPVASRDFRPLTMGPATAGTNASLRTALRAGMTPAEYQKNSASPDMMCNECYSSCSCSSCSSCSCSCCGSCTSCSCNCTSSCSSCAGSSCTVSNCGSSNCGSSNCGSTSCGNCACNTAASCN